MIIHVITSFFYTDLLAKVFYSWVQVRNLGAVIKDDIGRANTYHDKRLMKKVFNAWYFTKVRRINLVTGFDAVIILKRFTTQI